MTYPINFSNSKGRLQLFLAQSIALWLTLLFVFATTSVSLSFKMRENASTPGTNVEGPKVRRSPETGRKYCRP